MTLQLEHHQGLISKVCPNASCLFLCESPNSYVKRMNNVFCNMTMVLVRPRFSSGSGDVLIFHNGCAQGYCIIQFRHSEQQQWVSRAPPAQRQMKLRQRSQLICEPLSVCTFVFSEKFKSYQSSAQLWIFICTVCIIVMCCNLQWTLLSEVPSHTVTLFLAQWSLIIR